jgi:AraC-like DNA-binding protein/ligand-binding sensor protein
LGTEFIANHSQHFMRSKHPHIEALSKSRIYLDYQRAFTGGTGLPLALHGAEMLRLVRYRADQESPFCSLMGKTHKACAACYALQQELALEAGMGAKTLRCFAGLCESVVPVRFGDNLIAFLHTGQVLLQQPTRRQFNRIAATLLKWGIEVDMQSAEEAFFQTRVLRPGQYESLIRLLTIFAGHLAASGDELRLRANETEPAAILKARRFLDAHHAERLSLSQVARAVNASATYFSRRFKEATGMTFIEYLGRVRVEKAKNLLQNPNLRVSAIALEVGFQSVSQFNRAFKKVTGRSPKQLRPRQ